MMMKSTKPSQLLFCIPHLLISSVHFVSTTEKDIASYFLESKLVPDLIPDVPPDLSLCNITYPIHGYVHPGSILHDKESFDTPLLDWDADPNTLYCLYWAGIANGTLIATARPDWDNSDYAKRIKYEYHQWVIINIPGNNYAAGKELWSYVPPGEPPTKTLQDRYAILIYKQQHNIDPPKPWQYDEYWFQEFTPLIKFVKTHQLTGPVAGNMFYTHM